MEFPRGRGVCNGISRGGRGLKLIDPLWEGCGYFLEQHIVKVAKNLTN